MAAGEIADWQVSLNAKLYAQSWPQEFHEIVEKLANGVPLSFEDGVKLFKSKDLNTIGSLANHVKRARFGKNEFFNVNVHINQTNICTLACKFCAFRRGRRAKDAYQLDIEEYIEDLRQYSELVDEVHSVGGLHPEWNVQHYSDLFSRVKVEFPSYPH